MKNIIVTDKVLSYVHIIAIFTNVFLVESKTLFNVFTGLQVLVGCSHLFLLYAGNQSCTCVVRKMLETPGTQTALTSLASRKRLYVGLSVSTVIAISLVLTGWATNAPWFFAMLLLNMGASVVVCHSLEMKLREVDLEDKGLFNSHDS